MSDIIELVRVEELGCHDPRAVLNDFVDPFTMSEGLGSLSTRHDGEALAPVCLLIARDADNERGVGEGLLGLLEDAHVAESIVSCWS